MAAPSTRTEHPPAHKGALPQAGSETHGSDLVTPIWRALDKASFAVLSFLGPGGEPRSSGVVYAMVERRMYVVTAVDSLKARTLGQGQVVSVTVPVRRGGLLSLLLPIPPASITFCARATVHQAGSTDIASVSRKLASLVPEQRRSGVVLELVPTGRFLTYGIGVSLREMIDPSIALARVPVDGVDDRPRKDAGSRRGQRLSRRERAGLMLHRLLDRWLNPFGVWIYRRTKGGVARPFHVDALLLTTRGRRTGRDRTVVLQFFPDADRMIVTAANDGGSAYPAWYHNLVAQPDARVEVLGRTIAVRAEELPDDEAAVWWPRIVARDASYARFRLATNRPFPILRLAPR